MIRALLAAGLLALVIAPAAVAHGGGVPGYTSTVTRVAPAVPGLTLSVLEGDDRLELVNASDREIVGLGYDEEPYLRFTPEGVYRNSRSPATYLNDDRYGSVTLPATADPKAEPEWELLTSRRRYDWHDHRIHWMSPIGPPQVRNAPKEAHHVFDWEVPALAAGKRFAIEGSLDYAPTSSSRPSWIYIALPLAALAVAGGVGGMLVRRRRGR